MVGQERVIERVLIGLLTGGHVLLEGVPGLAKTLLANAIARAVDLQFGRVQFTIDMLPSDVTGGEVFNARTGLFEAHLGPVFTNLLLADEINRASPKVQSALLEAMQEHKVSIGTESHPLPVPFMVIATQNPTEQSGTFGLPEAQLDRFMMRVVLPYPEPTEEFDIAKRSLALGLRTSGEGAVPMSAFDAIKTEALTSRATLTEAMRMVQEVYVGDVFLRDCVELVGLTRRHPDIELGCSPRAVIALGQTARARAMIHGRTFVTPQDMFELAEDVLLHRMRLRHEAIADGRATAEVLQEIMREIV